MAAIDGRSRRRVFSAAWHPSGREAIRDARTRSTARDLLMEAGGGQPIRGADPGDLPILVSADGSMLYVHAGSGVPAQIASIDLRSGERTIVRRLLPPDPSGITSILRIVMTPDARSYAYTYVRAISALYLVEGIR